jgi:hypothetical protein
MQLPARWCLLVILLEAEDGGSMVLRTVCKLPPDYIESHPNVILLPLLCSETWARGVPLSVSVH